MRKLRPLQELIGLFWADCSQIFAVWVQTPLSNDTWLLCNFIHIPFTAWASLPVITFQQPTPGFLLSERNSALARHREPSHPIRMWMKGQTTYIGRVSWQPFWTFDALARSASARSGTEILEVWDSQILGGSYRSPQIISITFITTYMQKSKK